MSIHTEALALAYKHATELGWTHSRLCREYGITLPTLRRIRDGLKGKEMTDEYCMKVFLGIIYQAFHLDLEHEGGTRSAYFNNVFREILLAQYQVGQVK